MGKLILAFALAGALFAGFSPAVKAAPLPGGMETGTSANIIDVAVHCGPHSHYVRGHRNSHHQYVRGRCVRDHR